MDSGVACELLGEPNLDLFDYEEGPIPALEKNVYTLMRQQERVEEGEVIDLWMGGGVTSCCDHGSMFL